MAGSLKYLQSVREWIVAGEYAPGSPLREAHLAQRLAASRTTVRKLLSVIQQEDLVVYQPNQGFRVRQMDHRQIQQRLRVRASLEGLACRVVADKGVDKELQKALADALQDCISTGKRAPRAEAPMKAYLAAVQSFHNAVYVACDSEFLMHSLVACRMAPIFTPDGWRWLEHEEYATRNLPEIIVAANIDRARVLEAIQGGESMRAEALMREHYFMVSQGLKRLFDSGSAAGPRRPRRRLK